MLKVARRQSWPVLLCFVIGITAVILIVALFIFESFEHRYPWNDKATALVGWRTRDKPLLAVHMHKAGGTLLCHLAKGNGEQIFAASWDHNCNLLDDGPAVLWAGAPSRFSSCRERAAFLTRHGITFNGLEHYLDDADSEVDLCTDELVYMTILRHPIERLKSFASFHQINGTTLTGWASRPNVPVRQYHQVDNYYVRTLCGKDVFHQERGTITVREYQKARRVLTRFQHVLVLERIDQDLPALLSSLGWRNTEPAQPVNPSSPADRELYFFTEEQEDVLLKLNRWDMLLFHSVYDDYRG